MRHRRQINRAESKICPLSVRVGETNNTEIDRQIDRSIEQRARLPAVSHSEWERQIRQRSIEQSVSHSEWVTWNKKSDIERSAPEDQNTDRRVNGGKEEKPRVWAWGRRIPRERIHLDAPLENIEISRAREGAMPKKERAKEKKEKEWQAANDGNVPRP